MLRLSHLAGAARLARRLRAGVSAGAVLAIGGACGACGGEREAALLGLTGAPSSRSVAAGVVAAADPLTATIVLAPADTTLAVGDTLRLLATGLDSSGAATEPRAAIWAVSGDPAVTLADASGLLHATAPGTARVLVAIDGVTDSATIKVTRRGAAPEMPAGAVEVTRPTPPRLLDLDRVRLFDPARGRTIRVAAGGNLQAALDGARPGDQVLLAPGAEFRGRFVLRPKADRAGRWITVRTDLGGDSLAAGTRMTPELAARLRLARLVGTGAMPDPTVATDGAAAGWRLVELEITAAETLQRFGTLVRFGANDLTTREAMPGDLVLDRSWVHGTPDLDLWRCVLLNGTSSAVMNSTIDDCHSKGFDNYAIGGVTGAGPFKIVNNYLAAAGMGIFFGGSDPRIPDLSPSDFEIRRNHVTRPVAWKGRWTVKNLLEFKHARRALIEGNVFENHWADGQAGPAIVLKSTNQNGRAPWSQTSDVTFRLNVVRNSPAGISIAAKPETHPAEPAARIAVEDNLFYEIGEFLGTKNGRMIVLLGPLSDVSIARNTLLHDNAGTHAILLDVTKPSRNLSVVQNVFTRGRYGVWASGAGEGSPSIERGWPGTWEFRDNLVLAPTLPKAQYPPQSRVVALPAVVTQLGVGTSWADVRTIAGSLRSTGTTAGVNLDALAEAIRGVASEIGAPTPDRPAPPTPDRPARTRRPR